MSIRTIPIPDGWDGYTRIPSEEILREAGFTDRIPEQWYYHSRAGSAETLNITIKKAPAGEIDGEEVHIYKELVMDEFFGQPAYFGRMKEAYRTPLTEKLSGLLSTLNSLGLQIEVDPDEYGWDGWPANSPLTGASGEFGGEADSPVAAAEEEVSEATPAEPILEQIDPQLLAEIADVITTEAHNFAWEPLAHEMTMGQYVAPMVIRAHLDWLNKQN